MNLQKNTTPSAPAEENSAGGGVTTRDALTDTKSSLAQTARETAAKVKSAVSDTASRAKEDVQRSAMEKKEIAASRIGNYSDTLHESARSLEEKDPNIAWFTHRAADKLQGVADYVRQRDFSDLRHDVEDIARRHPAVFFGGLFVAGLVLGNVVKASRRKVNANDESPGSGDRSGWDEQQGGGGASATGLSESARSSGGI